MRALIPFCFSPGQSRETGSAGLKVLLRELLARPEITLVVLAHDGPPPLQDCTDARVVLLPVAAEFAEPSSESPFAPGSEEALAAAQASGLLADGPVLLLDWRDQRLTGSLAQEALREMQAVRAEALVSVTLCRDHPCQLQEPVEILGRCLAVLRETGGAVETPGPGLWQSRALAFPWAKRLVLFEQGEGPCFVQEDGTCQTAFCAVADPARAVAAGETVWLRRSETQASLLAGAAELELLAERHGVRCDEVLGWSPKALAEGLEADVLASARQAGGQELRVRLRSPAGPRARVFVLPVPVAVPGAGLASCEFLERPFPAGAMEATFALPQESAAGYLVCALQTAAGAQCDLLLPYVPSVPLWCRDPKDGGCVRMDSGQSITGRQDFPEVFEVDGSLALLGPGIRSLRAALASPRLAHLVLPIAAGVAAAKEWAAARRAMACELPGGAGHERSVPALAEAQGPEQAGPDPQGPESAARRLALLRTRVLDAQRLALRCRLVRHILAGMEDCPAHVGQIFGVGRDSPTAAARGLTAAVLAALPGPQELSAEGAWLDMLGLVQWAWPGRWEATFLPTLRRAGTPEGRLRSLARRHALRRCATIEHPAIERPFGLSLSAAADELAVANEQRGTVSLFSLQGRFLREVEHPGALSVGLAHDESGRLWVATSCPSGHNLLRSNAERTAFEPASPAGGFPEGTPCPWFLCAGGGEIFVQCADPATSTSRVAALRADGRQGFAARVLPQRWGMPGGLFLHQGKLVVAERRFPALWLCDPGGGQARCLVRLDPRFGQILSGLSTGEDMFFATSQGVLKLDGTGRMVFFAEADSLHLKRPSGVALVPGADRARLYVADYGSHLVQIYEVGP